jgi:hypothetical protein
MTLHLGMLGALVVTGLAAAQQPQPAQQDSAPVRPVLSVAIDQPTALALRDADRASLRLAISAVDSLSLDLERFEVIAPDAKWLRGNKDGFVPIAPPPIAFFRGAVAGEPFSHAFLAISESGAGLGFISRANGDGLHIDTDRSGDSPVLILRHTVGDLPDFDHFCAMIPLEDEGSVAGVRGLPGDAARGPRVLNVAVEGDQEHWQLFGNDAAALEHIAMVLGAVSDIFIRDLNMRLALRFVRLWPDGGEPFSAADVEGFRDWWQQNMDMTGLNLVHMFSGRRDLDYGGIAYLTNACTQSAFGISGFMLGGFPQNIGPPHLDNWDVQVVAHEMGHNLGTPHTHDYFPPVDACAFGADQRGTIMSYCHIRPGGLLNTDMRMHAATQDIIAFDNPSGPEDCLWHDCNGNLVNDAEDISTSASADANQDGVPDECQDCNSNGTLDPIDIALGNAADVNANGVPDSCESDCNGNGSPDRWECAEGLAPDFNGNRVPDLCEPDCDGNRVADFWDIEIGTHPDIDRNSRPDVCDDCDCNGTADWLDVGREFNVFIGTATGEFIANPVREYHAASGVLVSAHAGRAIDQAHDLAFGADRRLYVTSFATNSIVRAEVDTPAASEFIAGGAGGLTNPSALAFGPDGHLYVASHATDSVLRYNSATGAFIDAFVSSGSGALDQPWDLAFAPNGSLLVLTDDAGVLEYNGTTGGFVGAFAPAANLDHPRGMCLLSDGSLLVTSHAGNEIRRFSAAGADLGKWNDAYPLIEPWGMILGPNGNVYAATRSEPVRVIEYDVNTGRYLRSFIRGDDNLIAPTSIAFRPASPNDANGNGLPDTCDDLCPADFLPAPSGDGNVNVDELVGVILAWGVCPAQAPCLADIAPPDGDGDVNVDDLVAVLLNWGACE